jgi:4,5-DOPA dioxygenase extradiol
VNIPINPSLGSVVYISHGGGPLPLLDDKSHVDMIKALQAIATIIEKPSAIVVISAHWEEEKPTITCGEKPSLIYDYYGFPSESYKIQYPALGNPSLARKIFELLKSNGIEAILTEHRGFDHGLFVPLKLMYPDATIPCVQLSLLKSLDPLEHIQMGKALAELRKDNVLVIGSGFSFHNLKAFFSPSTAETQAMNESFEQWLMDTFSDTFSGPELSEQERAQRLLNWEKAPAARYCHPREEHLLPLHVCYGMVESKAKQIFTFEVLGKKASCYLW